MEPVLANEARGDLHQKVAVGIVRSVVKPRSPSSTGQNAAGVEQRVLGRSRSEIDVDGRRHDLRLDGH
jgi:hypothetical protein